MPTNEKEYNGYLFDQLAALERVEKVAIKSDCKEVLEAIAEEKKYVERKLYQNPPLSEERKS